MYGAGLREAAAVDMLVDGIEVSSAPRGGWQLVPVPARRTLLSIAHRPCLVQDLTKKYLSLIYKDKLVGAP